MLAGLGVKSLPAAARKLHPTLWSWGNNDYGQLGLASVIPQSKPIKISDAMNWLTVSSGIFHTLGIKVGGGLWAWGRNALGELGIGNTTDCSSPVQVGNDLNWIWVGAGGSMSIALRNTNTLWAWGLNSYGRLGIGNVTNRNSPTPVGANTDWKYVYAGAAHVLAIKNDNSLWSWGLNSSGQLGHNNTTNLSSPVRVGTSSDWKYVSCGRIHTLATKTNNTLWAWGENGNGQLGLGNVTDSLSPVQVGTDTNWMKSSSGRYHSMAIKTTGTLWGWGRNQFGQLGRGNTTDTSAPFQVGSDTNWASVRCSQYHTLAIKNDGTMWAWGSNFDGQLGLGQNPSQYEIPVRVGSDTNWSTSRSVITCGQDFTCVGRTTGTLWSFGRSRYGRLGTGTNDISSPVQVFGGVTTWNRVNAGQAFAIASRTNGTLWAWGRNNQGQLGNNTTSNAYSPRQIGSLTTWTGNIGAGYAHTLAIRTNGTLWGWGRNTVGQLGFGDIINKSSPVQIGSATWSAVCAGVDETVGIRTDGTLWGWGDRNWVFGTVNDRRRSSPEQIGTDTDWSFVVASFGVFGGHAMMLKSNGTIWGLGRNSEGQLGVPGASNYRSSPIQVGSDTDWSFVAVGNGHTMAIKTNGTLWAWGYNNYGQLGLADTQNRSSPVQVGTDTNWASVGAGDSEGVAPGFQTGGHTVAVKTDGTLWGWGKRNYGQTANLKATQSFSSPVQIGIATNWKISTLGASYGFRHGARTKNLTTQNPTK